MYGENFVKLSGFMSYPEFSYTDNGYPRFRGRIAVPIKYNKSNGEEAESKWLYKIAAWGSVAEGLNHIPEGMPIIIVGRLNERKYVSKCPTCSAEIPKYWSDVQVDSFSIPEDLDV